MKLEGKKIGFAITGSFCTFDKAFETARSLRELGAELTPIMSFNAAGLSTRFGTASEHREKIELITSHKLIETIGPQNVATLGGDLKMRKAVDFIYENAVIKEAE